MASTHPLYDHAARSRQSWGLDVSDPSPPGYLSDPPCHGTVTAVDESEATSKQSSALISHKNKHESEIQPLTALGRDSGSVWRPTAWRSMPLLGIASLLGVLLCALGSVAILLSSSGKVVNEWGYGWPPAVYLAILSVTANALLTFGLTQGLVISFWRSSLAKSSLSQLHYNWLCGRSVTEAISNGFRSGGRITALACILTTISAMLRGPLNQKASSIETNKVFDISGNMTVNIAQILPDGYGGRARDDVKYVIFETIRLKPAFAKVVQEYNLRSNMTLDHAGCGKTCTTTVQGFGFRPDCSISPLTIRNGYNIDIFRVNSSLTLLDGPDMPIPLLFPHDIPAVHAHLKIQATFFGAGDKNPTGVPSTDGIEQIDMKSHVCTLVGGIVEYKIKLEGGTVSLASSTWTDDKFVKEVKLRAPMNTETKGERIDSIIGGFEYTTSSLFDSRATYKYDVTQKHDPPRKQNDSMAELMPKDLEVDLVASQFLLNDDDSSGLEEKLKIRFADPMDYMLKTIREISFRAALSAGRDNATAIEATQTVEYLGKDLRSIYVTNKRFMIGAMMASIIGVMAVSLTYYGWWELGREVSMSPFEIAKAFDAPMFEGVGSNLSHDKYPKIVGKETVMYGEDERGRLVMGKVGDVGKPLVGMRY